MKTKTARLFIQNFLPLPWKRGSAFWYHFFAVLISNSSSFVMLYFISKEASQVQLLLLSRKNMIQSNKIKFYNVNLYSCCIFKIDLKSLKIDIFSESKNWRFSREDIKKLSEGLRKILSSKNKLASMTI